MARWALHGTSVRAMGCRHAAARSRRCAPRDVRPVEPRL